MTESDQTERRRSAAVELEKLCPDCDPQRVVDSLSAGMNMQRDFLIVRAHDDVERKYGADSMYGSSFSETERQIRQAKIEIEAYSCIVINEEVTEAGIVDRDDPSFLKWIFHLRMGDGYRSVMDQRVDVYRSPTAEGGRMKFVRLLQRSIPKSTKAPLVLFRLFPHSLRILAAAAFGLTSRARELRDEQIGFLPAIADCHRCHGRVLDDDEVCRCCGNPVWSFAWLLAD